MLDPHGIVTNWNTGAQRIKGYTRRGDRRPAFRATSTPTRTARPACRRARSRRPRARASSRPRAGGCARTARRFWASVVINPIRDADGELIGFAKITRDITERREAQQALQRAQEQLAPGAEDGRHRPAHRRRRARLQQPADGHHRQPRDAAARARRAPTLDADRLARSVDNAMRGAQRAAALTQRLLAFSRRQPLDPKPVDVNRLVTGMSELLRRTLGEQIAIETVLAGGLWRVARRSQPARESRSSTWRSMRATPCPTAAS